MYTGKIGCIIQARTTSTRLPGKVLKTVDFRRNKSILEQVIARVKRTECIDEVIVATTTNPTDDAVVDITKNEGIGCYRGSENDVLSRFYEAATKYKLDTIVRITSDCPFIDPNVIQDLVMLYEQNEYDYVSNGQKRTYPHGLDCEIFSMQALSEAHSVCKDAFYKEHVTTYLYSEAGNFRVGSLELNNENYSDIRITVDTKLDYALACCIQDYLGTKEVFYYRDIVELLKNKSFLKIINEDITQKKKYDTEADEIKEAIDILKLQEQSLSASILEERLHVLEQNK